MSSLFRREVIEKQRQRSFGDVTLSTPLSNLSITLFFSCIGVGLIVFSIIGEYSRKERVLGYLAPQEGLVRIFPNRFGLIEDIYAKTGQSVNQGDTLFSIQTDTLTPHGFRVTQALIEQLTLEKSELENQRELTLIENNLAKKRLTQRTEALELELSSLEARVKLQRKVVENQRLILEKFSTLVGSQVINPLEEQIQENEFLEASQLLNTLTANVQKIRDNILDIEEQINLLSISVLKETSELERAIISTQKAITQARGQENYVIEAPIGGKVASITINRGQQVSPQRAVASIVPAENELIATLLIPSRAAGLIEEGQEIRVLYDAFPYQKFGTHLGYVNNITRSVVSISDLELAPNILEPVFLVEVKLEKQFILANGERYELQPGMTITADIILEKRKIWEWIFEPLLSAIK